MSWGKNSSRNFQFDRPSTPYNVGPGSYEIEPATSRRQPTAAFKNREKRSTPFDRKKNGIPAPGKYDPIDANTHIKISSSFKSNSERSIYNLNDNPSPADHSVILEWGQKKRRQVPDTIVDKPFSPNVGQDISGFDILEDGTLRPKKIKKRDGRWIGPGTYNIEDSYRNGHSMKQPYRNLDLSNKAKNPGPGEYDTCIDQFNPKPKKSYRSRVRPSSVTSARKKFGEKDPSEMAPKGYELKHQPWNKEENDISSATFKSRTKREIFVVKEKTPAPTRYQKTNRNQPSVAKAAFGQRTPRFLDYDGNNVPGPGAYDHDDGSWATLSSNYSGFTGRRAFDTYNPGNGVPGPGSYETKSIWERNKKKDRPNSVFASMVPRDKDFGDKTPGPGAYTIETKPKSNSKISIHSRSKKVNNFFQISSRENPSPDAYYTDRSLGNNVKTIPKDSKFEKANRYPTPGPGTYNVEHDSLIKKSFNSDLIGVV